MPLRSKPLLAVILLGLSAMISLGLTPDPERPVASFEGKDTLLRPVGYREWVFVGSSLGLRYDPAAGGKPTGRELYHNVYINPTAYRTFASTGKFPEGTMMVLELASAETKAEPGLQGSFQKDYVALEASVKDSKRFQDGWAYFSFDEADGKPKAKAQPFPSSSCWSCHHQKAATDHVFTQFYPVLRALLSCKR
jgi:Cytochrome P460